MKQNKVIIYLNIILFGLLASACLEEQSNTTVSQVLVSVKMPENIKEEFKFASHFVTLRSDRMLYTSLTNEKGEAVFNNIIPDIYNVYTSWDLNGEQYFQMSDSIVENRPALISGIKSKVKIFSDSNIGIETLLSVKQSLLISKVYASGTRDINNAAYRADSYIEIFNNSDEVQYIDGVYLALVEGDSPIGFPAALFPTTIHARQIYRFPGKGSDYSIQPGASIVVANSAKNHILGAPTSVDLQNADFEFKGIRFPNNDKVPAMTQVYTSYLAIKEINLQSGGVNSVCLFKSIEDLTKYSIVYPPGKTSGNMFITIPAKEVFDGIEILGFKTTGVDMNSKRLQSFIDAGYKTISSTGGLNHESIERKVDTKRSTSERKYLVDTNNSQNDAISSDDPTPKRYDKALLLQ